MDKDRPLFLAGAAGFIGSAFVRLALESGYRVIAFDLLTYAGHRCNIEDVLDPGRCELIVGDICDGARVVELLETHQPAAVVNFAAESHVDRSIADSDPFISTNVVGTAQLLKASLDYMGKLPDSRAEDFRFVQISTDEVFGALPDAGRFSETTPYDPRSPYAASKASADHLVRAFGHTYGLPVIITHCGNNYGPRQYPEKLIPLSIMNALGGRPIGVYGDGKNVRDWIHVEDHCRGVLSALEKGVPGESYCFGAENEWSNIDLIGLLCDTLERIRKPQSGKPYSALISFISDRLGHDFRYSIDPTKAHDELGFIVTRNFEDSIEETIRWYLENEDWRRKVTGNSR